MDLGEPIASGREADVFALDDGRVLRRYRAGGDTRGEADVMAYVKRWNFPVPMVHSSDDADLIMERLDGPTMVDALAGGVLTADDGGVMLADLHRRLHTIPARGGSGTIVHLDLHPNNVLLTGHGPVVIDWCNARDGDADLDTASTAPIMAQVATGSLTHPASAADAARAGSAAGIGGAAGADQRLATVAGMMLDAFLREVPDDPCRLLDEAVAARASQPTLSAEEIAGLPVADARMRGVG